MSDTAKIGHKANGVSALIRRADALDVELAGFRSTIDSLAEQIELVSGEIDKKVEYRSMCDA